MSLHFLIDKLFIIAVIASGFSLVVYISCGIKLAALIRESIPDLYAELGKPFGVSTLLMGNTALYEDFVKNGAYKNYQDFGIRRMSDVIIRAKRYFHFFSLLCLLCLIGLIVIK